MSLRSTRRLLDLFSTEHGDAFDGGGDGRRDAALIDGSVLRSPIGACGEVDLPLAHVCLKHGTDEDILTEQEFLAFLPAFLSSGKE